MTLEQFYIENRWRNRRNAIGIALFLALMIPLCLFGDPESRNIHIAIILSIFVGGSAASWSIHSELKKAVKQNLPQGRALS